MGCTVQRLDTSKCTGQCHCHSVREACTHLIPCASQLITWTRCLRACAWWVYSSCRSFRFSFDRTTTSIRQAHSKNHLPITSTSHSIDTHHHWPLQRSRNPGRLLCDRPSLERYRQFDRIRETTNSSNHSDSRSQCGAHRSLRR